MMPDNAFRSILLGRMKSWRDLFWILMTWPLLAQAAGANFQITTFYPSGQISWTNAFTNGICTVETAVQLNGSNGFTAWIP
jgi:hypothetical protein